MLMGGRGGGRASAFRRVFAYGATAAMTPYLLIKIGWVVGALLGLLPYDDELGLAGWVLLNGTTIVMAVAAIALALALVMPWGDRIPALPLLGCAWIGTGFLVPMLPFMLLNSLLDDNAGGTGGGEAVMPAWEAALIGVSFAGMALGLAVALPLYMQDRWPHAFTGRVAPDSALARRSGPWAVAVAAAVAVGLLELYWAVGGTLGLDHPDLREPSGYLLNGNSGVWALLGAGAGYTLARGRPARLPLWLPMTAAWLVSGFLFAWGAWRLPFAGYLSTRPTDADSWPENLAVAAVKCAIAVVAGLALLRVVQQTYVSRRSGSWVLSG